jgi:hypothetical protein
MFLLPAYLADWKPPSTYHVRTYLFADVGELEVGALVGVAPPHLRAEDGVAARLLFADFHHVASLHAGRRGGTHLV